MSNEWHHTSSSPKTMEHWFQPFNEEQGPSSPTGVSLQRTLHSEEFLEHFRTPNPSLRAVPGLPVMHPLYGPDWSRSFPDLAAAKAAGSAFLLRMREAGDMNEFLAQRCEALRNKTQTPP